MTYEEVVEQFDKVERTYGFGNALAAALAKRDADYVIPVWDPVARCWIKFRQYKLR